MIVKLLTERYLEFLSLKEGFRGSSESTLVKMSNCWKTHAAAQNFVYLYVCKVDIKGMEAVGVTDDTKQAPHKCCGCKRIMRGSRKFLQSGSNFDYVTLLFFFDDWREDPNTTISGPSSARQRNAIQMAFCWWPDGGPTLNVGLVAVWFYRGYGPVLLRNPIFL